MKIYLPKIPNNQDLDRLIESLEILGPAIALSNPKRSYLIYEAINTAIAFLRRLRNNEKWRDEGVIEI
jgi:hypothetical protein